MRLLQCYLISLRFLPQGSYKVSSVSDAMIHSLRQQYSAKSAAHGPSDVRVAHNCDVSASGGHLVCCAVPLATRSAGSLPSI